MADGPGISSEVTSITPPPTEATGGVIPPPVAGTTAKAQPGTPPSPGVIDRVKGLFGSSGEPSLAEAPEPVMVPDPKPPQDLESIAQAPTIDTATPLPNELPATPAPEPTPGLGVDPIISSEPAAVATDLGELAGAASAGTPADPETVGRHATDMATFQARGIPEAPPTTDPTSDTTPTPITSEPTAEPPAIIGAEPAVTPEPTTEPEKRTGPLSPEELQQYRELNERLLNQLESDGRIASANQGNPSSSLT